MMLGGDLNEYGRGDIQMLVKVVDKEGRVCTSLGKPVSDLTLLKMLL